MRIKATDYHVWWLVRAHLIVEMRHAGIGRLKLQQEWGQREVAKALVPDMNSWVSMWIKESWELLEEIVGAVAVHRAIETTGLLCVPARRLCHQQA